MNEQIGALSIEEIRDGFKEHSVLGPGGDLFQVLRCRRPMAARSVPLESGNVPIPLPESLPPASITRPDCCGVLELRLARRVEVLGGLHGSGGGPDARTEGRAARAMLKLIVLIPAVLFIATAGGWWMSRRALQPVDQIIDAARSIGEQSSRTGCLCRIPRTSCSVFPKP